MTFGHSDGRDKGTLQHSRKCFPGLLYRSPETLETVLTQEEAISKEILSVRVQVHRTHFYTASFGTSRTQAVLSSFSVSGNSRLGNPTTRFVDEHCKEIVCDKISTDVRFFRKERLKLNGMWQHGIHFP